VKDNRWLAQNHRAEISMNVRTKGTSPTIADSRVRLLNLGLDLSEANAYEIMDSEGQSW
jgi:hypothetical protein